MANIDVSKDPISVNITVENSVLLPDAFNSIGFLTYNENSPRNLVVNKLDDLLNNGFTRDSKAYNFCYGVFLQGRLNNIVIRSVRKNESYYDAYISDNNSSYYYVIIESKDVNDVINFTSKVSDQLKLVFYSSNEDHSSKLSGLSNLVFYYNTNISIDQIDGWLMFDDGSFVLLDDGSSVAEEIVSEDISCSNSTGEIIYTYTLSDDQSSDYFLYKFTYNNISYDYTIHTSGESKQEGKSNGSDFVVRDNTNNVISNIPNLYFNWIREGKEIKLTVKNQVDSTTKITQSVFGDEADVGITMNKVLGGDVYTVDRENLIGKTVASGNPSIILTETGYLELVKFCLSAQKGV